MDWRKRACELDAEDPLREFRSRFITSDPSLTYLDGNSLGRMPLGAVERMRQLEREWGDRLVRAWNESWIDLPKRIGGKIARIIGADEDEVIVADSTTVNLYKLAWAALNFPSPPSPLSRRARGRIVTDDLNFPSDHYVFQGLAEVRTLVTDGIHPPELDFGSEDVLLSLSAVAFKSGALYPVEDMTIEAHQAGMIALWDLSHAAGAVDLKMNEWNVDLAVGCTYKYLNGGPGSPAFLYVRRNLQDALSQPIQGWFGRENPFDFGLDYRPAKGIARFASGTPPVASLALVEAGVDLVLEAGMAALVTKSRLMTAFLIEMYDDVLAPLGFRLNTPRNPAARGSHIAFGHDQAWQICRALIESENVVPDFRAPDTIRFACVPIYGTFGELEKGVDALRRVVESGRHLAYPTDPTGEVT